MSNKRWNEKEVIERINSLFRELERKPTKRDDGGLYNATRKFYGSWNNALNAAGFSTKKKQSPSMPDKNKEEFYYFLGLLITDGHISYYPGKDYRIKLYTSYKEEQEMIMLLISKLFDYTASIRSRKTEFSKNKNYEIYISSKELCEFITGLSGIPAGTKSKIVEVPEILVNSGPYKIAGFLRGVIDGDGSVIKGNVIKIFSGSEKFMVGIKKLLQGIGVRSGKISREKEKLYVLRVCGIENTRKLKESLYKNANFYYARKKNFWNQYI